MIDGPVPSRMFIRDVLFPTYIKSGDFYLDLNGETVTSSVKKLETSSLIERRKIKDNFHPIKGNVDLPCFIKTL